MKHKEDNKKNSRRTNMNTENVKHLDKTNFETTIAKGVTLVDFWAPWCGPCRMVGPILDEMSELYAGKATIAKVNVDNEQDLAVKFNVRGIPTVIVFKDGKLVNQAVGVRSKTEYEGMIKNNL
jgi:thioredoxin 1